MKRSYHRNQNGSILIQSLSVLVIFAIGFVLLLGLGLNAHTAHTKGAMLRSIAGQAAKVIEARKYWLGMKRPTYWTDANWRQASHDQAHAVVNHLCQVNGLPAPDVFEINEPASGNQTDDHGNDPFSPTTFTTVRLRINHLQLPFRGIGSLPDDTPLEAVGFSSSEKTVPYSYMNIQTKSHPNDLNVEVAMVPCFGFFRGNGLSGSTYTSTAPFPNNFGAPGQLWVESFRGLALETILDRVRHNNPAQYGFSNALITGMSGQGEGTSVGNYPN